MSLYKKPDMKFYFGLFLFLFVISCTKEKNSSSSDVFPNAIGDQWIYRYNDGYSVGNQYIYVNIVGIGILPDGESATIWTTTLQDPTGNKYLIDSSFVVADNQKAVFYHPPCRSCIPPMFDEKRRYVFPLRVGNVWFTGKIFGDTTKVLNEGSLTVPAGTFANTFELSKTIGYVTNSYTKDTIWLTPNVGVIKFVQDEYSLGWIPGDGVWELASYQLR